MPFLRIETNAPLNAEATARLLEGGPSLIADILSKPVEYIQVIVDAKEAMAFGGTTEPNALVELRSLGVPADTPKRLAAAISSLLQQVLAIPPDRVFINFVDMNRALWGWNGSTFG